MTIRLYDQNPKSLKKTIARLYGLNPKRGEMLRIPAIDDVIFIHIDFERDARNNIPTVCNYISQTYWQDRLELKYDGLEEDLLSDLWRADNG
ncbi:MAG: hypothetical protein UHG68_02015 [Clostridia bacterium]|nr:hypothetical protein [Clostridia bacterium]